jgi:hypothetical protein
VQQSSPIIVNIVPATDQRASRSSTSSLRIVQHDGVAVLIAGAAGHAARLGPHPVAPAAPELDRLPPVV